MNGTRKLALALGLITIAVHFASYAVDSLKSTMAAHVGHIDRAGQINS